MPTNPDSDDNPVVRATKATGERRKRDVVHRGLRMLLATQAGIRRLKGRVGWTGSLNASRRARIPSR